MGLSSRSLLLTWVALETNILSFISVVVFLKQESAWSGIKYFFIQRFGSIIFIFSCISLRWFWILGSNLLIVALLLKIGAGPLHGWILNLAIDLSWETFFLLRTLQKILPLFVILKLAYCPLYQVCALGAGISLIGGLLRSSIKKLLVYSSVLGLAWMFTSKNFWISCLFLLRYSISFLYIRKEANKISIKKVTNKSRERDSLGLTFCIFIWMLNLAGIPPFLGFYAKVGLLTFLMSERHFLLLRLLLIRSGVFVFVYLQIRFNELTGTKSRRAVRARLPREYPRVLVLLALRLGFLLLLREKRDLTP